MNPDTLARRLFASSSIRPPFRLFAKISCCLFHDSSLPSTSLLLENHPARTFRFLPVVLVILLRAILFSLHFSSKGGVVVLRAKTVVRFVGDNMLLLLLVVVLSLPRFLVVVVSSSSSLSGRRFKWREMRFGREKRYETKFSMYRI
tara:strand:- start:340 stop:777 length:438 start_codon:yes stop_codon:yes gene_type:complete